MNKKRQTLLYIKLAIYPYIANVLIARISEPSPIKKKSVLFNYCSALCD